MLEGNIEQAIIGSQVMLLLITATFHDVVTSNCKGAITKLQSKYRTMKIIHGGKLLRFLRISYVATAKVFQQKVS